MDSSELHDLAIEAALRLPGSEVYQFTEDWEAARVGGKWFLLAALGPNRLINVKAEPVDVTALVSMFESIAPGYHMNKRHWVSIRPGADVTPELVEELVTDSYLLVVGSLARRNRPVDPEQFAVSQRRWQ